MLSVLDIVTTKCLLDRPAPAWKGSNLRRPPLCARLGIVHHRSARASRARRSSPVDLGSGEKAIARHGTCLRSAWTGWKSVCRLSALSGASSVRTALFQAVISGTAAESGDELDRASTCCYWWLTERSRRMDRIAVHALPTRLTAPYDSPDPTSAAPSGYYTATISRRPLIHNLVSVQSSGQRCHSLYVRSPLELAIFGSRPWSLRCLPQRSPPSYGERRNV